MQTTIEPLRVAEAELTTTEDGCHLHRGRPFTGISERTHDCRLISEVTYVNGLQHGRSRIWHLDEGCLVKEAMYVANELHGIGVEWHPTGERQRLTRYEHGIRVQCVEWNEQGVIVGTHQAREAGARGSVLQSLRKLRDAGRGLPPEDEERQAELGRELDEIFAGRTQRQDRWPSG